ncbi:MAG: Hsp20/alpha crystallin family protein [Bacillota bacterium]
MFGLTPYNRKNRGIERRPRDIFDIETMFEEFFSDTFFPSVFSNSGQMKVDIKENDNEYVVEAELPGVNKEDINLELLDERLTISVERNEHVNEERENYIRKERRYGSMSRTFIVPNIDNEKVTAKFENGVLHVNIPKKEPGMTKRNKIDIN